MKHISEVWALFEKCKTEKELEETIGEIPNKFGAFSYERIDKDTIRVTNFYYDKSLEDHYEDKVDFDIPEIKENEE